MFTGIVLARGRLLTDPAPSGRGGSGLAIGHGRELAARLEVGASLAVSGVCLTVTEVADDPAGDDAAGGPARSLVELSPETLSRTTLGHLAAGAAVNLEPALRVGDALGGHWVQGHVDGVIAVLDREDHDDHATFDFELPDSFVPYLVDKGSVAIDGVSLTVARCLPDRFRVALIPHTLEATTLGDLAPGDHVNLEVDVLAKYVERMVAGHAERMLSGYAERMVAGRRPLPE
jgi:riboflavin synthase